MLSRPLPLLPFDQPGAEQLEWDGATDDITFAAPVGQVFRCAHDALHRIEIFIEPTFHFKRSHLWLIVSEGDVTTAGASAAPPLRAAGPLAAEALTAHGWFAFEFEPIPASAGKTFSFILHAPDAAPGNALRVRTTTRPQRGARGMFVAGTPRLGALTFRASCVRAPELLANFQRFRAGSRARPGAVDYHPLLVRLEISRPCNLHCVMCQRGLNPFDAKREGRGFMSPDTVRALDPVLPTLLRVIGLGLGEPFLNPHYLEILRHIRTRNAFANVFTSTNGTRLSDAAIDAILDEGLLSELQISLDGAERATFEQIRRKASFDTVVGAFERVTAARARRGTRTLSVTGAMLVMKPNLAQVLAFVRRMAALGVDRVSLDSPKDAAFQPLRADSDDEMARILDQVTAAHELLAGTGTELSGPLLSELILWHRRTGRTDTLPRWGVDECALLAPAAGTRASACGVPWESLTLAADGTVNVCCNSIRRMGHVHEAAVTQAWTAGAPYDRLRHELVTRTLHHDCRTCLGENFVMAGEATPLTYLHGSAAPAADALHIASLIGRPLVSAAAPHLTIHATLDPLDWRAPLPHAAQSWRVSGSLELDADIGSPLTLALAVHGIVRAFTVATPASPRFAQWSGIVTGAARPLTPRDVTVYLVNGRQLIPLSPSSPRPLRTLRASLEPNLHGFIDEVRLAGHAVHLIGWARDRHTRAPAHEVLLTLRDEPTRVIRPWLPRPDVVRVFGDASAGYGYILELPLALLAQIRPRCIKLLAVDPTGVAAELEWSELACNALETLVEREWGRRCEPANRPAPAPPTPAAAFAADPLPAGALV